MKKKAVFLDRDGTLNKDYGYVYKIQDFELIDGVIEGLRLLQEKEYLLIVITNQSGIGRNYFSDSDLFACHKYMQNILLQYQITLNAIYYCPHLEEDQCICRKPKFGLFLQAIHEFSIDVKHSFAIGDRERDISLFESNREHGILITSEKKKSIYHMEPNFLSACKYIINQ